jgi:hypothetical protein
MFSKCFKILLNQHKRRQVRRQLQWQNFLRQRGIGIHTRILEIKQQTCPFAGHVQCSVHVRLRLNGKNVSHWVQTILAAQKMLSKGDLVHIRYSPAHFRRVLVMQ